MSKVTKKLKEFLKENRQFLLFVLLMSVFRSAVADWYTVPTGSMQPTIEIGDRITVNKMAYDVRLPFTDISMIRTGEPARGDILIFESEAANERMIKRVIGLPGDTVAMHDEKLIVNGQPVEQQQKGDNPLAYQEITGPHKHTVLINPANKSVLSHFAPVVVPAEHYLVLGDHRTNSADSRAYGFVPRHELRGQAKHIAFSLDYDNYYMPRKERLFMSLY